MAGRNVAIFGATGSIGRATIDVLRNLGSDWRIAALSAHSQIDKLHELTQQLQPRFAVLSATEPASIDSLPFPTSTLVLSGPDELVRIAGSPDVDIVVAAIVGRAGVESTLAALQAGKKVALANKETLVCAGPVVQQILLGLRDELNDASGQSQFGGPRALAGTRLLPVDSEHSAIFQCLSSGPGKPRKLVLTASGGPFRDWTQSEMEQASVEQALRHPTWKMGKKISIDSATMMNKALEIIEARWLFDVASEDLEVVVHPQSIVHSMVEFHDGSVIAQLSPPDMRLPIQYALTYPERTICPAPALDRGRNWELSFHPVDLDRFPAIPLGFEVARVGGTAGSVVNAANEVAVDLFLQGEIRFTDIVKINRVVLENHTFEEKPSIERLLQLDRWARAEVRRWSCRAV